MKLFLPLQLNSKSTVCEAKQLENGSNVKITINYKKKLQSGDRDMIQQFNIIFKRIFNVLKFKMHNRNFYDPKSATSIKQHKLDIWPGKFDYVLIFRVQFDDFLNSRKTCTMS